MSDDTNRHGETHQFKFPYFSQNEAYEIHSKQKQRWIGKTSEYKNYIETIHDIVNIKHDIDLIRRPIEVWHTVIAKQQHRKNQFLEGKPYMDVGNPAKVLHDAIEGCLIDDDSQIMTCHMTKKTGDENKILTKVEIL